MADVPNSADRRFQGRLPLASHTLFTMTAVITLFACDTPGIRLVNPDVSDSSAGVTFRVTLEDSALAEALGWEDGVPEATVFYQRVGEPFAPESRTTDSLGQVRLGAILPGQFKVAAYRVLDLDEASATGGVVRAFGDGLIGYVSRHAAVPMNLVVDNAGSLVFSEWWTKGTEDYVAAKYVELYNNSDTTVYLDGMLLGTVWATVSDRSSAPELSCAATESWRNDPLGVWSPGMHKFPGSGRDFPVAPGQAVTVAMDAVDHSPVYPGLPDLSGADFEFEGSADVDNPDVPNMPYLGPEPRWDRGSGLEISSMMFLAQATEFESLDRRRSFRAYEYARVPTELIMDVVRIVDGYKYIHDQIASPCDLSAPRNLERLEGGEFLTYDDLSLAAHRRILRTTAEGRLVLQDVNTSFLDFVHGPRTPGRVER